MADIEKVVRTKYKLDTKQAEAQAMRLQRRMKKLGAMASKVSGRIGALGRAIAAPAGLGLAGAAGLVKHLIDVGREAEDAELGITGLLQSVSKSSNLPLEGFERAREAAARLRQEFIKLAQDSPVQADDVREAFEMAMFPLSRAGLSLQQQAELARATAIADLSNRVKGTAAGDIKDILQGTAGKRITTAMLRPIAEEAAKLAKKGKLKEAAALIQKQLTPDPKLLDAYRNSASGMLATFFDKLKIIKEKIAKPLLKFLIEKTGEWSAWLENNQERVAEIAKSIGKGIVDAMKKIITAVKWLAENWKTILTIVKTLAVVWVAGKLVSGISALIGLASKFASVMRMASAVSMASAIGTGKKGGILSILGKAGGAIGLAVTAAAIGEDVGEGIGSLVAGKKGRAAVKRLEEWKSQSMSKDEYNAYVKSLEARRAKKASTTKKEESVLDQQLDPTKAPRQRGAGGGGRTRVRKMEVAKMEVRDRDFARLSGRFVVGIRRQSRAQRQIAGLGLGAGAIGVGV